MPPKTAKSLHLAWKKTENNSGTTLELRIIAVEGFCSGQLITLQFQDEARRDAPRKLDLFSATLLKYGKDWIIQNIEDGRDAKHPAHTGRYTLTDHVKVLLPGNDQPQVVLLDPVENEQRQKSLYELGLRIICEGKDVALQLIPCIIWSREYYHWISNGLQADYWASQLHEGLLAQDVIPANDTWVKQEEERRRTQWNNQEKQFNEYIQELLKDPDSPLLVNMERVREYRELSEKMYPLAERFRKLHFGDPQYSSLDNQLRAIRQRLDVIEKEHAQYMDISTGIPASYKEQVRSARKRKARCAEIDAIADTPFCMIVCCLPLGGLVEGGLEMLKGNYLQGLASAGLDVFTFGGFAKWQSARRICKALEKSTKGMRAQIFEARYLRVCMDLGEQRVAALKGLSALASGFSAVGGSLVKAVANLDDLVGEIRDFKSLLANKKLIGKSLDAAQKPGYKNWLTEALKTHHELLVWGALRQLAQGYMLADTVLKTLSIKDAGAKIQARLQVDLQRLEPLLVPAHPAEWQWLKGTFVPALNDIDPAFFADKSNGLLYNGSRHGRDVQKEWLQYVSESRQQERRASQGLNTMKSAQGFHDDLGKVHKLWKEREQAYKEFCPNPDRNTSSEVTRNRFAVVLAQKIEPGAQSLEQAVEGFLMHLEDVVKLVLPDASPLAFNMPRAYVHYAVFEYPNTKMQVKIIKQLLFDGFQSTSLQRIEDIYGE